MKNTLLENLYVLLVFATEGAVLVFAVFVLIYILFPRLRREIKEDFSRKLKW